ncbi:MAG: DUF6531 domain-containing protein, partial [Planctomycetota bacterium]
ECSLAAIMENPCLGFDLPSYCAPAPFPSDTPLGTNPPKCCLYGCHWEYLGRDTRPAWVFTDCDVCCPCPATLQGCWLLGEIPWIDQDGDGKNWNEDDDGGDWEPEPDSAWGDLDGDGVPNILDLFPYPPGHEKHGTANPHGTIPGQFLQDFPAFYEFITAVLGLEFGNPDLADLSLDDLNGDGVMSFVELAASFIALAAGESQDLATRSYGSGLADYDALIGDLMELKDVGALAAGILGLCSPEDITALGLDQALESLQSMISAIESNIATIVEQIDQAMREAAVKQFHAIAQKILPGITRTESRLLFFDIFGEEIDFGELQSIPLAPLLVRALAGDPVDTGSGAFHYQKTDLHLEGRGLPLRLERFYYSRSMRCGIAGHGWSMPWLETYLALYALEGDAPRLVRLEWGDGQASFFAYDEEEELFLGQAHELGKVRVDTGQTGETLGCETYPGVNPPPGMIRGFVYRNPQGMEYHFCPPMAYPGVPFGVCWLREIWDIEGNRIVFKRNAFGEVTEIVDSVGRHTYLTYDNARHLLTRIV